MIEHKPDYQKSIVNLVSTFLKHFDCQTYHEEYPLEGSFEGILKHAKKIVIFLVDGMGYEKFAKMNEELNFQDVLKVSSVFPTTTTAVVTSWFTAKTPKEHGMLGYILYLREIGSITNMIEFSYPGVEGGMFSNMMKKRIHRLENVFDALREKELYGGVLTHASIANSGLSYLIHRNGHIMSYYYMGDLLATLKKRLSEDWTGILYVYWGHLDGLGHKKGPDSDAYTIEMKRILTELKRFSEESLNDETLLVITSDHGMIQIPPTRNNFLKPSDNFNRLLSSPPGGEMRMMYFYLARRNNVDLLKDYFNSNYPNTVDFLTPREALDLELFGTGRTHPELYNRIGDVIMVAREDNAFTYLYSGGEEKLSGMHGGLTSEELYVPAIFLHA